ncbi:diaminopimelate epimerase [bacterium SCN 62-11]|nr:diaminopimelate epimerase [Candidatus Eremiobacteraeota bacterium]ODT73817.1 MAG: diaminopimelate epimerase [bacterium SCN 62-11]
MTFEKWEGLGNDFVFVAGDPPADAQARAIQWCDRRTGVGADGLVYLNDEPRMVIFNSDGSRASTCGNALRCVGAWRAQRDRLPLGQWEEVATDSGQRRLRVLDSERVTVDMGPPGKVEGTQDLLPIPEVGLPGHFLSMGNPHLVVLCPEGLPSRSDFESWGSKLTHSIPGGVNVEFVARRPDTPNALEVLVWERGAGPTQACGSGACAALVVAVRVGWVSGTSRVGLPGGELEIDWNGQDGVLMTGPARNVFRGELV